MFCNFRDQSSNKKKDVKKHKSKYCSNKIDLLFNEFYGSGFVVNIFGRNLTKEEIKFKSHLSYQTIQRDEKGKRIEFGSSFYFQKGRDLFSKFVVVYGNSLDRE